MQKQTALYIPKPCHEDWNKMTPTERGKFCSACSKHVIDFSLMSDTQILNILSNQSGKVCGRFDAAQLERPLVETKIKKKKSWWMALAMPLLFLFDRSEAQEMKAPGDTTVIAPDVKEILPQYEQSSATILVGKVAVCNTKKPASLVDTVVAASNEITITGKVVDENHCLMQLRKEKKMVTVEFTPTVMQSEDFTHLDNVLDKENELKKLELCIENLPQEQKQGIQLFYLERAYAVLCS